ncbi:hypothetical protein UFOVP645_7 [uncultured Caudovirales phage]|uniref:Uncharacterized protein n=1 Tax=uncultured Caudovirales phage TaxID=2100421 RepID=A0A6J5NAN2_9CAUD|nr:hypothetical protein UFOVP645_7 [uncultured Caudovirales phage]
MESTTELRKLLESNQSQDQDPKPEHDFDYEDMIFYMKNEKDLDKLYKWAKLFTEYYEWLDGWPHG